MCSVHRSRLPQGRDRKPLLFAKCSNGLLFPIVKKRKQSHVDKPSSKLGEKTQTTKNKFLIPQTKHVHAKT